MKRLLVLLALLLLGLPLFAAAPEGYERMVLSIAPSQALCAWFSRYDTRLHVFNDADRGAAQICLAEDCQAVAPHAMARIEGPETSNPLPAYIYVPRADADRLHLALMVESTNYGLSDRAFTEIPIIREREFKSRMQILGVRVDEGFRVTLRVYGLDVPEDTLASLRIYDQSNNELLWEDVYGFHFYPNAPAIAMECDISNIGWWITGRDLRVEVQSSRADAPIYAFISTTDNATQRFTVILPK